MKPSKQPPAAPERSVTSRHAVAEAIDGRLLTAREISAEAGISEKDVYDQLEHIRCSAKSHGQKLKIVPAECKTCGFVFRKRERLSKPSRCPVCKKEFISPPAFMLES